MVKVIIQEELRYMTWFETLGVDPTNTNILQVYRKHKEKRAVLEAVGTAKAVDAIRELDRARDYAVKTLNMKGAI